MITRVVGVAVSAVAAGLDAGPVAAGIAGVYVAVAIGVLVRRRRDAAESRAGAAATDGLVALAADLRAGAEPGASAAAVLPAISAAGAAGSRIVDQIRIACRVAEVTGARLSDLLDRVDTDARAVARVAVLASAQAAGVRATAWLLAGLPVGGIALGYGIGADPLWELLHTKVGALCSAVALSLQVAGLAWTQRLADTAKAVR